MVDAGGDKLGLVLLTFILVAAVTVLPPKIRGDFDRDGRVDVAEIVKVEGEFKVVIHPGRHSGRTVVIDTLGPRGGDFYLDTARAGTWKTWCGKGGGSDLDPCPRNSVVLKGGELTFGYKEASEFVVIWTGNRYETVLLSD